MFNKFITSSVDANKVSLAVKGFLFMLLPIAVTYFGIDGATGIAFIDALNQVLVVGSSLVSAVMILLGLARKLQVGRWTASV